MKITSCRVYTRQCLANASSAVGPTVGTSSRRLRHEAIEARGVDQEDQEKSDLQGKIQFYQKFSASQQQAVAEQRRAAAAAACSTPMTPSNANNYQTIVRDGTATSNAYRFSTFKSSNMRKNEISKQDPDQLDIASLGLDNRHYSRARNEIRTDENPDYYYRTVTKLREPSSNAESRRLDKQSYFFHGHKTEKNVDRTVTILEDHLRWVDRVVAGTTSCGLSSNAGNEETTRTGTANPPVASPSTMSCFGTGDRESFAEYEDRGKHPQAQNSPRKLETRRDSGNIEFTEMEGEIFRKNSNELLQDATTVRRRNFSFRTKEKQHRSLESLEKSLDYPTAEAKSLDDLPDETRRVFSHAKQRSLDSSRKTKNLAGDPGSAKARKRPGFFERVGRSFHFLTRERETPSQDLLRREEEHFADYPQTDQEKCEYFLRRHGKDFFDPVEKIEQPESEIHFFDERPSKPETSTKSYHGKFANVDHRQEQSNGLLDPENLAACLVDENFEKHETDAKTLSLEDAEQTPFAHPLAIQNKKNTKNVLTDPSASVDTHVTTSGNKDSLEIGYSISQLGRLYLQNLQNASKNDNHRNPNTNEVEKRDRYLDWMQGPDLRALSHRTNSTNSLGRAKPQGNLDILKGILLDLFVCICI